MQTLEYQKMATLEKSYWWYQGRLHLLGSLLGMYFPGGKVSRILEVGCGTGEITSFLTNYGSVTAVDVAAEAIRLTQARGVRDTILGDVNEIDLTTLSGMFDLVVAFDVLEHIQDDVETLRRIRLVLGGGGYFFISVPAHKFLWSEHDEALHHKRRYHSLEITRKLEDAGFTVVKKTYFVCLAFPAIMAYRLFGNLFGRSAYPQTSHVYLSAPLNRFMISLLKMESSFIKKAGLPFGSTLVVVAKKR